ncbi:hypothetical protein OHA72_52740 [Dactylosporangium sp. NBC_01737]|uniref:hypothetical protein n=1 Tax=Dactylosporangium sp. NBC_01737 TaxID=2975959 RepID=UPI002E10C914|nr:hypothetical protein OHA72_52740 [Dactylosporangium sp. NBC_01737]
MPFESVRGPALPVDSPGDVAALVDLLGPAATDDRLRNSLCDHFAYVAGVHVEWFRPHQERVVVELLGGFQVTFDTLCALLHGAPDSCVEHLERELRRQRSPWHLDVLAAIGTEPALTVAADVVRSHGGADELENAGFWTPPSGPLRQRFSSHRLALQRRPVADLAELLGADHPVGLPLDRVVRRPEATPVDWHFLSLRAAALPGVPAWPAERLHLVETDDGWAVAGTVGDDGRWYDESVEAEGPPEDSERDNDEPDGRGMVVLRPFDDTLVYCNGHILSTPDVYGMVGGPPIGVYSNPSCRSCDRLMFHVATVTNHIRGHGDGFRSLYICEDCRVTSCTASNWN